MEIDSVIMLYGDVHTSYPDAIARLRHIDLHFLNVIVNCSNTITSLDLKMA